MSSTSMAREPGMATGAEEADLAAADSDADDDEDATAGVTMTVGVGADPGAVAFAWRAAISSR